MMYRPPIPAWLKCKLHKCEYLNLAGCSYCGLEDTGVYFADCPAHPTTPHTEHTWVNEGRKEHCVYCKTISRKARRLWKRDAELSEAIDRYKAQFPEDSTYPDTAPDPLSQGPDPAVIAIREYLASLPDPEDAT